MKCLKQLLKVLNYDSNKNTTLLTLTKNRRDRMKINMKYCVQFFNKIIKQIFFNQPAVDTSSQ